ncbi:ATP-grasp ribosomal peptide maturase, SAV_5884 family [Actinopolyspora alba]|uniref:ATP-grasp ribosomal peptide maturase, SAV_5884 family n=1 Tax=Actinopolyspora alba TaxID=673379 RepID=A0A1I2BGE0_9ACTN|nr:ATP-grasp ribosomal peptide maturase [Actinopolyspora alba]SFE54353.1 ATP-grasp ribosomal peptide maturase, SAV_5884 family [Actinopolyspora alba]
MTVLILARDIDPSADAMVEAVQRRGTRVYRVNTGWFPAQLGLAAELRGDRWCGHLTTPARTIDLAEVTGVYYRAPEAFQFPNEWEPQVRQHAFLEAKYGLGGVLASLPAVWVNHPSRLADAAYKPMQLAAASQLGLCVPETAVTNEPATFTSFARRGRTVTKMLGNTSLTNDDTHSVAWTRVLDTADLDDLTGIESTVHLAQRWAPKQAEARVIAVGDTITTVRIHAESAASRVDWRSDISALHYELIDPPQQVTEGVRALMRHFGLHYGALDFVITPDEQWIFLEINPGGQYGWLEAATGAAITDQLAELLTSDPTDHEERHRVTA